MDFDIKGLEKHFIDGLKELQADYSFSLDGTLPLTAAKGTTGITKTKGGYKISYSKTGEFYREFVKLLNGKTESSESCAFEHIGVMVDCSRNAVMKTSALKMIIRKLAVMGYDTMMLYTEDTYEIKSEPFFGYLRGRYTACELREIDTYAKIFGIELVPCIQTLAHFNALTRWERFAPILDCNDILLAGDERTYELIDNMFKTLTTCFSSKRVHIGMDEAHMVGLGKYLDKYGYENRFEILLKHLNRVMEIASKYGYSCTMWSDMFFRLANSGAYEPSNTDITESVLNKIPKNLTLMYWDYYHNDSEYYDEMLKAHKKLSDKISFAGGAWRWNTFTPSNTMSINRNNLAFNACKKYGVKDVLITLWGDNGGECSTFAMLPTLVAGAENAYGNYDYKEAFKQITGTEFNNFTALELADVFDTQDGAFSGGNFTKVFLYNDFLCGIYDFAVKPEYGRKLLDAAKSIKKAGEETGCYKYIFNSVAALAELVSKKYDFGVRLRKSYKSGDKQAIKTLSSEISELIDLVNSFYIAFKEQWYTENKSFGFEIQDIRLGGLKQRMLHCKEILSDYLDGKTQSISELEQEILVLESYEDKSEMRTNKWWHDITSVNRF